MKWATSRSPRRPPPRGAGLPQHLLRWDVSYLDFQTVYRLFNDEPDVVCEWVCLPPKSELVAQLASGDPLLRLEAQTPVGDFNVLAFLVSFEWDYTNVLTLLRLARVPVRAEARMTHAALAVVGSGVTFVNPEPLAPFADVVAARAGEALVLALVAERGQASARADVRFEKAVVRDACRSSELPTSLEVGAYGRVQTAGGRVGPAPTRFGNCSDPSCRGPASRGRWPAPSRG